jgi:hypothetical protein
MVTIIDILKNEGPMLSGKLSERISKTDNIKYEAAKKRLSRATQPVEKLRLGFDKNQSFVFLEEQREEEVFWKRLINSLKNNSKAFYSAINSLMFHYGYLQESQIASYTFSPIKKLKGHKTFETILSSLKKCGLVSNFDDETLQLSYKGFDQRNLKRYKAVKIAKKQVMKNFTDWAGRINLTSWKKSCTIDKIPEFFKFQWSFTSPCYLKGLTAFRKDNKIVPGFIIADILIGRKVSLEDADYLIKKIEILEQQKNARPYIPILLCENLHPAALKALKGKGIMVGFIRELFGSEYAETLTILMETITNANDIINSDPEKFFVLQSRLSKLEGWFGNLKGDMFEFFVAYYYTYYTWQLKTLEIGKIIKDRNSMKSKEIDVFINSQNEIKIIECKGHNSPLSVDYVKDEWLDDKIPTIRNWILNQDDYKKKNLVFEIWATSGFDDEAQKILEIESNKVKPTKYKIEFFNGNMIRKMIRNTKNKKLIDIIDRYYK